MSQRVRFLTPLALKPVAKYSCRSIGLEARVLLNQVVQYDRLYKFRF
jgi:hypothetical protein